MIRPTLEQLLEFENKWPQSTGPKDGAIRETFHMSGVRYYQLLNMAIDNPAALELDPILIHRLADQRTTRRAARASRQFKKAAQ